MARKIIICIALSVSIIVVAALAVRTTAAPQQPPAADLVLRNGKVVTVSDAMPEAQALAVRGSSPFRASSRGMATSRAWGPPSCN